MPCLDEPKHVCSACGHPAGNDDMASPFLITLWSVVCTCHLMYFELFVFYFYFCFRDKFLCLFLSKIGLNNNEFSPKSGKSVKTTVHKK